MPALRVHVLRSHFDTAPQPIDVTWDELVAELTNRPTGPLFPPDAADKKSPAAGTIPASLKRLGRGSDCVQSVNVLVLDYDKQRVTEWERARKNLEAAGLAYAWHSTRSHRPVDGSLSYRMIVPLSVPFTDTGAGRWSKFYDYVVRKFAASINRTDGSTKDPGRLFYLPFLIEGAPEFESGCHPGQPLDVEQTLAEMQEHGGPPALAALLKGDHALLTGWEKIGYDTLYALLRADPAAPYAKPGGRDKALFACATWIAPRIYRQCTPE